MALAQIYRVTQDLEGNVVTDVLSTVTLNNTSTLAPLFADAAGTLPLPNPTTNNAQYGSFALFVDAGTYDMQFVKAGFTFETQRNITLRDPAAGVNTITGTANRVIVAPVPGVGAVTLSTPQDIAPDSLVQFQRLGLGTPAPGGVLSLDVLGGSYLRGSVGIGITPDTENSLTAQFRSRFITSVSIAGVANYGVALHVGGNALIDFNITAAAGFKPGGGPWADSSTRSMKTHIADISNALALLLAQRGRVFLWTEPTRAAALPGLRYGLIAEEVTLPQWQGQTPDGTPAVVAQGFEALCIEALREVAQRLEGVEAWQHQATA